MRNEKIVICKSVTEAIHKTRRLQTLFSINSLLEPIEVIIFNIILCIFRKIWVELFI